MGLFRTLGVDNGGEGGIRTHDTLARIPVFETGLFNHSSTSPFSSVRAVNTKPEPVLPAEHPLRRRDSISGPCPLQLRRSRLMVPSRAQRGMRGPRMAATTAG